MHEQSPHDRRALALAQQEADLSGVIGDVRVLIHTFAPGRAEVRFAGPHGVPSAEVLRYAITELTSALRLVETPRSIPA